MPDFLRKPNRLAEPFYQGRYSYFLTLCTRERKKLFTNERLVRVLLDLLREKCLAHSLGIYAYCFMPDHLHLVLVGVAESATLPAAMRAFKGAATAEGRKLGVSRLWEKSFYDHVIRTGEGLDRVASYILMNPVRAGLVREAAEWPFSGSFMFEWKKLPVPDEPYVPPWKKVAG